MVTKRILIALFVILTAALAVYSPVEAASASAVDLPSLVFLSDSPTPLVVTRPDPIDLPTFILGGQWANSPFELYVFTGDGSSGRYIGSDGKWQAYSGQQQIHPVLSSATPNNESLVLPSFINFSWTAFNDTSDKTQFPDGDMLLTLCVDNKLDGVLQPADSSCGSVTVRMQTPACVLSLSSKAITQTISEGGNAQQETITASDSCGSSSFTPTVLEGGDWMSAQSGSGTLAVSFNASGLPASAQPYTGRIQVTSAGGATDYITASLTVNPKSACTTLTASRASIAFTGSVVPLFNIVTVNNSPQTVTITDCSGNIPANLTLAVDSNSKSWLSAAKNADGSVNLAANGSAGTGTHYGTVTVSAPGFTALPIGVTIIATGGGTTTNCSSINIWPSSTAFTGVPGSASTQSVTVQDSCGAAKSFSASPSKSWMTVTPASGSGSFDVTVTIPSVSDSGTINVTVGGAVYKVNVTASPTGPACTTPTNIQLLNASGSGITSLDVTGSISGVPSQTVSVRDNCYQAVTNYTYAAYQVTSTASCTAAGIVGAAQPSWMNITQSSATMNITFPSPAKGSYSGCIVVSSGSFAPVYLPVTLTVADALPVGVTPLVNGVATSDHPVRNSSQSDAYVNISSHTAQIYSAQQTGTGSSFASATKDWATYCDMIVMYSGPTCGSKLPDINDYNAIISLTAPGVPNYSPPAGQMVGNYRFYWAGLGQQNQYINVDNQPPGCYYVFMYNTSAITGQYVLTWTQN